MSIDWATTQTDLWPPMVISAISKCLAVSVFGCKRDEGMWKQESWWLGARRFANSAKVSSLTVVVLKRLASSLERALSLITFPIYGQGLSTAYTASTNWSIINYQLRTPMKKKARWWWNPNFQQLVSRLLCTLMGTFVRILWTARQYHSVCMLGFGVCSFFGHYPANTSVWSIEISFTIPK